MPVGNGRYLAHMEQSEWVEIPTELFERLVAYTEAHGLSIEAVIEQALVWKLRELNQKN